MEISTESLTNLLSLVQDGESYFEISSELYKILISKEASAGGLLQSFLCSFRKETTSLEKRKFSRSLTESRVSELAGLYRSFVKGAIQTLVYKNPKELDFYKQLWESVVLNPIILDEQGRIFSLTLVLLDYRLTYFQTKKGVFLPEEEYDKINSSEEMKDAYRKCAILSYREFYQWTEQSSLLLDQILKLQPREYRSVLLANVLRIWKDLDKKSPEDESLVP